MKQTDTLQSHSWNPAGFLTLETTHTQTRIWFMGDGVARIRTSFSGHFSEESLSLVWTAWEDHYDSLLCSERHRTFPLAPEIDDRDPNCLFIRCDGLVLTVQREPFAISCGHIGSGFSFRDVPGRAYTYRQGHITHSFCLDDSYFYGFGEKTGHLEKTGVSMRMSNKDACGYDPIRTDPLYKHITWVNEHYEDERPKVDVVAYVTEDEEFAA